MIDICINSAPIIIIANCRSGSTALAFHLANKYALKCFIEPFDNHNVLSFPQHKKDFINFILSKRKDFVLKFMAGQITEFNCYEQMAKSSYFKIKLNRRNKVEQILSLYVADKREKYAKLKTETKQVYSIPIDLKHLVYVSSGILRNDFLLNNLPFTYNLDLIYEDLGFIKDTDHTFSDLPDNAEEIKEEIKKILNLQWDSIERSYLRFKSS
jgi:hypothetical protein